MMHRRGGWGTLRLEPESGKDALNAAAPQSLISLAREASRISCLAVKSRCAREWGGWGRLSEDGPGQHNPDLPAGHPDPAAFEQKVMVTRVGTVESPVASHPMLRARPD
jgi:hypothetical protein